MMSGLFNGEALGRFAERRGQLRRRHSRHGCSVLATLQFMNSATLMYGLVTEVSVSGLRFRPAKSFLLERNGAQVSCAFEQFRLPGKIVASRANGYGIALHEEIDLTLLEAFVAEFGNEPEKPVRARSG
ncbi:MAG: PilZ domain-containing protein [Pseudomonadota bacterium]